jgi:hypothetical protein
MKVIQVTKRNGDKYDVIVDDDFYHKNKIGIMNKGYATVCDEGKVKLLHRLIARATDASQIVDHINRNKLDNRKENLRIVTKKENATNKINKGYSFHRKSGLYTSTIDSRKTGGKYVVKYFKTKEEALEDYKIRHAIEYGEFSPYYGGGQN